MRLEVFDFHLTTPKPPPVEISGGGGGFALKGALLRESITIIDHLPAFIMQLLHLEHVLEQE